MPHDRTSIAAVLKMAERFAADELGAHARAMDSDPRMLDARGKVPIEQF